MCASKTKKNMTLEGLFYVNQCKRSGVDLEKWHLRISR